MSLLKSTKEIFDIKKIIELNEEENVTDSFHIGEVIQKKPKKTHNFDFYELLFFEEGEATVKACGVEIEARRNTAVFLHVGDTYEVVPGDGAVKYTSLKFSYRFMFPFEERTITFLSVENTKRKLYTEVSESDGNFARDIFARITVVNKEKLSNYDRVYIITGINWLLFNFIVINDSGERIDRRSPIEKVLFHVNNKYIGKLTLKELADKIHVSPTYFSQLFKKEVGMSLQEYIKQKRLGHAYDTLLSTQSSVADVAYRSGYNSVSQFSRDFKKRFGMAPASYKKYIEEKRKNINNGEKND